MSAIGDSSRWLSCLVTAYELVHAGVLASWPECRAAVDHSPPDPVPSPPPKARTRKTAAARSRLEDPITRNLIRRLRLVPQLRGRFHIVSQFEIIDCTLDRDPDPLGYIDVAILFSVAEDEVCLALECKRLNVNGTSLATKYVTEGIMRFVSGKYTPAVPIGGMIGYVMDGRVQQASDAVLKQIRSRHKELLCSEKSIVFFSDPDHFSTTHARKQTGAIELRHQLLSAKS